MNHITPLLVGFTIFVEISLVSVLFMEHKLGILNPFLVTQYSTAYDVIKMANLLRP